MLPIDYDLHCRACHSLAFDKSLPFARVPHRLQPDQIRNILYGHFARVYQGVSRKQILDEVHAAETLLFTNERRMAGNVLPSGQTQCGMCHEYPPQAGFVMLTEIVAPAIPEVWYRNALFNHAAHEATDCLHCHPANLSDKASDVLIPGFETCRECHGPFRDTSGRVQGGARYHCAECHTESMLAKLQR
jgi:hypothetical protein